MTAEQLIAEIRAYGRSNPDQQQFVHGLVRAIVRIDGAFTGPVRDQRLREAKQTIDLQVKVLQGPRRTAESRERLEETQQRVLSSLERIAVFRPADATLH